MGIVTEENWIKSLGLKFNTNINLKMNSGSPKKYNH